MADYCTLILVWNLLCHPCLNIKDHQIFGNIAVPVGISKNIYLKKLKTRVQLEETYMGLVTICSPLLS